MVKYKQLTLDDDKKVCYIDDNPINLTKTEYLLLEYMLKHKNKIFNRKQLVSAVWNDDRTSIRAVDTSISRIRKKMGVDYITTRTGFGYGIVD